MKSIALLSSLLLATSALAATPVIPDVASFQTPDGSKLGKILSKALDQYEAVSSNEVERDSDKVSVLSEDGTPYIECTLTTAKCTLSAYLHSWVRGGVYGSDKVDQTVFNALLKYAPNDLDVYVSSHPNRTTIKQISLSPAYKLSGGKISCTANPSRSNPDAFDFADCDYNVPQLYSDDLAKEVYEFAKNTSDHVGDRLKGLENNPNLELYKVQLVRDLKDSQYRWNTLRIVYVAPASVPRRTGVISNITLEVSFVIVNDKFSSQSSKEFVDRYIELRRTLQPEF